MGSGATSSGITKPGTIVKFVGDERNLGPHSWRGMTGTVVDKKIEGWEVAVYLRDSSALADPNERVWGFDISELEIVE